MAKQAANYVTQLILNTHRGPRDEGSHIFVGFSNDFSLVFLLTRCSYFSSFDAFHLSTAMDIKIQKYRNTEMRKLKTEMFI